MSSTSEKMDVLDLIISVLKEHEETISELVGSLQIILEKLQKFGDILEEVMERCEKQSVALPISSEQQS